MFVVFFLLAMVVVFLPDIWPGSSAYLSRETAYLVALILFLHAQALGFVEDRLARLERDIERRRRLDRLS